MTLSFRLLLTSLMSSEWYLWYCPSLPLMTPLKHKCFSSPPLGEAQNHADQKPRTCSNPCGQAFSSERIDASSSSPGTDAWIISPSDPKNSSTLSYVYTLSTLSGSVSSIAVYAGDGYLNTLKSFAILTGRQKSTAPRQNIVIVKQPHCA